jgi:transcriptional regulator with XRE-family HTH domain
MPHFSLAGERSRAETGAVQPRDIIPKLREATRPFGAKKRAAAAAGMSAQQMSGYLNSAPNKANPTLDQLQRLYEALLALQPDVDRATSPVTGTANARAFSPPPELEGAVPPSPSHGPYLSIYWYLHEHLTPAEAKAFFDPLLVCVRQFKSARHRGHSRKRAKEGD